MSVSFAQLCFADPTAPARRLLWHVLSVGRVWRDEPERHAGADKAGLFLFWVERGRGCLALAGAQHEVRPGPRCWLVDLRQPRGYLPAGHGRLVTAGFRFHGPGLEAWREALGATSEFRFKNQADFVAVQRAQRRLLRLVRRRPADWEWQVHVVITGVLGRLLAARGRGQTPDAEVPAPVKRTLDAVLAAPTRDWQARELAAIAAVSYSRLRALFKASQQETLHEFLQRIRLDEARQLLCDPRLSVKDVATRLNFSSEFYFSHFFRRATGMSPTRFRQEPRG